MKNKIYLLKKRSFPSHAFFDHLLRGTEYYQHQNFERAAEEWGAAEWLDYDTPINLKHDGGRIFCGGFIREVPFLFFLYAVFANKADGIGTIKTNGISKNLVFNNGRLVRAATSKRDERIGDIIQEKRRLSPANLDMLATKATAHGKKIGQYLVEKGLLSKNSLQEILSLQIKQILVDIFLWQRGYFYFFEKSIGDELIVNYDPLNIARIATDKRLSFTDFRNKIPNSKTIFRLSPSAKTKQAEIRQRLKDNYKFIFSLIDGTRNIEQIKRFSGINEDSVIDILYQMKAAGMIRQTQEIIEYEDKQYNEISNILISFLEIYTYISHMLFLEFGTRVKNVIQQSRVALKEKHQTLFVDIPLENPDSVRKEMILKNIAHYFPELSQRNLFIEAFCELFEHLHAATGRYLGWRFAAKVALKIKTELKNIERYAQETSLRRYLLETFKRLTK